MTETPRWLRDRLSSNMRKIASLRDQLREKDVEWERQRLQRWLKEAQIDHSWLEHWVTLT
jgi:hypothetical protein